MKAKLLQLGLILLGLGVWAMANPVTITINSTGPSVPGGIAYFPYTITVASNGSSSLVTVACDDFVDNATVGNTFTGWVSDYTDLRHTYYNGGVATPDTAYKELAFLYQNILASSSHNETAAINFAMWDLFDSNAPGIDAEDGNTESQAAAAGESDVTTDNENSAFWLNLAATEAKNNFPNFDFSLFRIYTPTNADGVIASEPGRPQEFIGEVPEPATLALLGTGLLILGFAFRRRLSADGHNLQA